LETPIGFVPAPESLTLDGLNIQRSTIEELLRVDPADWNAELDSTRQFFNRFGSALPQEIWKQHEELNQRLGRVTVPAS